MPVNKKQKQIVLFMDGEDYDRVLLDRVAEATAIKMVEKQYDFKKDRDSIDLIFIAR